MTSVLFLMLVILGGVKSDPDPSSLRQEGQKLFQSGQPDQALPLLQQAKSAAPDDMELRLVLGAVFLKLEKFQQALNEYSEVVMRDRNHLDANLGRARALIGLDDGPKAANSAKLVVEIAPDRTDGWIVLGDAYSHDSTQDYPRAVESYKKAYQLEPDNLHVAINLAKAHNHKKETKQAVSIMEQALKQHPDNATLLTKLAESYYVLRKLDRADELVSRILNNDPKNTQAIAVSKQIQGRRAYEFWVPILALIAFPLFLLLIRWMKKGQVPKLSKT